MEIEKHENEEDRFYWTDFVATAVDVIRTIYRRNLTGRQPNVPSDALKIIYK